MINSLSIFLILCIPLAHLSNLFPSAIDRIRLLGDLGFEHFQATPNYYEEDPSKQELEEILSDENFELIWNCLIQSNRQFSKEEISDLMFWADFYVATGFSMKQILASFQKGLDESVA